MTPAGQSDREHRGLRTSTSAVLRRALRLSILAGLALYLFSGIHVVKPEQQALVVRLGKLQHPPLAPGWHYHLPYPIDRVYYLKPSEVKSVHIAVQETTVLHGDEFDGEAQMEGQDGSETQGAEFMTGDENIIRIALNAQYRIHDKTQFVFRCAAPESLVQCATEMALCETAARTPVDDLLTSGKQIVLERVKLRCQEQLESMGAGIEIIGMNFTQVAPPAEVSDAFKDVASALEDRDRLISEAQGDKSEALPTARGEAQQTISGAMADRESKVNRAHGDAERFNAVLKQYRLSGTSEATLTRFYIESMEKIMAGMNKYFIDPPRTKRPEGSATPEEAAPPARPAPSLPAVHSSGPPHALPTESP